MERKRRTPLPAGGGESSEPQEAAGGSSRGTPHQPERGAPPQQGAGGAGYQGGRGYAPQTQQGGRGGGYDGGGRGRGGVPQHQQQQQPQHYGAPPEYPGRGGGPSSGDPSRPPIPELYQATHAPYPAGGVTPQAMSPAAATQQPRLLTYSQAAQKVPPASSKSMRISLRPGKGSAGIKCIPQAMSEASSSSRTPEPSPEAVTQQLQQLSASSKSIRVPRPHGKSIAGKKCIVKANHFFAELPYKDLHQYDVTITPEVPLRRVNCDVMDKLVELYRDSELGKRLPAYDGLKNLYTAGPLPFKSKEFKITLDDKDEYGVQRRDTEFRVVIILAAPADLHYLVLFLKERQTAAPQEALDAFNMALRKVPTSRYCNVGPSFYSPKFAVQQPLGGGLEGWRGFHQSIHPTQMGLSLSIDMSSTAFITPLPVTEFLTQLLNRDVSASSLSATDRVKIENALRDVKVEAIHHKHKRIKYRVSGLTSQATQELTFPGGEGGTPISVVDYFRDAYLITIQRTQWPCLKVGNRHRPHYLPMEVCKIVKGQRWYNKMLNASQNTALLKLSCQRPDEREKEILQIVRENAYHDDPYVKEFGIKISEELASVEARILPAPWLRYRDERGIEKDFLPQVGPWRMKHKKMYNGGTVQYWICINFSQDVQDSMARRFCSELAKMCRIKGMKFALKPLLPTVTFQPEQVERALKTSYHDAMTLGKELDLLIVILPDNKGSLYGDLKRICETDLGIVSQCCLTKHVLETRKAYLANVSLKINVKVGGRNTVLVDALSRCLPLVSDGPTIIFGADVAHPQSGDKSIPSIASVVASQDWPHMMKYTGLVCAQAHHQEIIEDLYKTWEDPVTRRPVYGGMIRELLISFRSATGSLPKRIIFYRDGVGEGQYDEVLFNEIHAIYKAYASIEPNYQPLVTFVLVMKRHQTKLFANNHGDRDTVDCSGNILPGTVVDSKICHPTEFDFYLCSHSALQGTSHPAHYHVLWDTNKFTADELQLLTNNLCYTFAKCTASVSIVPPVYCAHLLAYRARFYMEPKTVGGPSVNAAVRSLAALKENVKRVMFYC